jgi:hypothetical protein
MAGVKALRVPGGGGVSARICVRVRSGIKSSGSGFIFSRQLREFYTGSFNSSLTYTCINYIHIVSHICIYFLW